MSFVKDLRNSYLTDMFLEKYFFFKNDNFVIEKISDVKSQKKGIDYIINGKCVDIKSAINYANTYLDSYILELSHNGGSFNGWFLKDSETEYYFLAYPCSNYHYKKIDNFEKLNRVDFMIINKQKIKNILNNLLELSKKEILNHYNGNSNFIASMYGLKMPIICDGISGEIVISTHLKEEPINLKLPKDFYLKHCDAYVMVFKDNYIYLKNNGNGINKNDIIDLTKYQKVYYY